MYTYINTPHSTTNMYAHPINSDKAYIIFPMEVPSPLSHSGSCPPGVCRFYCDPISNRMSLTLEACVALAIQKHSAEPCEFCIYRQVYYFSPTEFPPLLNREHLASLFCLGHRLRKLKGDSFPPLGPNTKLPPHAPCPPGKKASGPPQSW